MPFDLLQKRSKQIQKDMEQDAYIYAVKKEELAEFVEQIKHCSNKGEEGVIMFKNLFNVDPREIRGYGNPIYNKNVVDDILEYSLVPKLGSIHKHKVYKCFGAIDHFNPNRIIGNTDHNTAKDSWNCLLTIMGRPNNIIIRVVKKGERSLKFKSADRNNPIDNERVEMGEQ